MLRCLVPHSHCPKTAVGSLSVTNEIHGQQERRVIHQSSHAASKTSTDQGFTKQTYQTINQLRWTVTHQTFGTEYESPASISATAIIQLHAILPDLHAILLPDLHAILLPDLHAILLQDLHAILLQDLHAILLQDLHAILLQDLLKVAQLFMQMSNRRLHLSSGHPISLL